MTDGSSFEKFKADLRGELLRPGDAGYDDARKIWNGMIDKRPAFIARCAGVADVIHSVRFADANNLLLAVRGGGHNVASNAVCDGGLVIDLSRMKSVRVDPARRTARAEPGVTWRSDFHRRHCWAHPRRWLGLSGPEVWPGVRQPSLGRSCHGRGPVPYGQRR